MELNAVHITNFRSVEDSERFDVGRTTCLVGKNEAGKSAILLALAALSPHPATPAILDKERDYPRRSLTKYDETHKGGKAQAIATWWTLSDEEVAKIETLLGPGVLTSLDVKISRSYGDSAPTIEVSLDYNKAVQNLFGKFKLDAAERSVLSSATNTTALLDLLKKLANPTPKHLALLEDLTKNGYARSRAEEFVRSVLPRFMYFAAYDRMDGAIQIEHAKQLIAKDLIASDVNRGIRLFTEFLEYAGVSMDEITEIDTYETFNAKLQAASNNITDQILEYWTQNPDLSVSVRIEPARSGDQPPLDSGTIARARIYNALHRVDTPFSERSAGFVWFFSFLVKFAQVKDDDSPVILLLDEPGLTLHGKAQADLLRFFEEKLSPFHQIIYSTHSPFMVPHELLSSVRIVEDQVETKANRRTPMGTKVRSDVLSRDPDTLFPLQGALGYDITQTLFVGQHTLLVEGPSDILYLQALSSALAKRGRVSLDARWTICPSGGIDKISPFVSLFSGNALHIAALSDHARSDRKKIETLRRSEILRAGHFHTFADFLGRDEADVEDVLHPELFVAIVNAAYDLGDGNAMTVERLQAASPDTTRIVKQTEAAFNVLPPNIPTFDHFRPADWLIRNPHLLDADSPEVTSTLDMAESIFRKLNQLL